MPIIVYSLKMSYLSTLTDQLELLLKVSFILLQCSTQALQDAQLGRPDFAACKIHWKHIAQCLNLASHFASSKTLIFNKGFACTNLHWNLYIVFIAFYYMQNMSNIWSLATCKTFDFILNFAVSIHHHATHGIWQMDFAQLGRLDFATCKIHWKHIVQCLNLASHFTSSKTLIFNKGFACTNVHWNLYIVFIAIHYVFHCILPYTEHVQHLKSGHMQKFWFYFEFCSQYLPSCYKQNVTNGFNIM